jgi:hypothetical protein
MKMSTRGSDTTVRNNGDKEIQNYQRKYFPFWFCVSNHIWRIKALALHLIHRKPLRIALLKIDHNRNWVYPSVPQPICRDLFDSHAETIRSHLVIEELNYLPLRWCSFFLSKCFCFVILYLTHNIEYQSINRDITGLNRCVNTPLKAWIGTTTSLQA